MKKIIGVIDRIGANGTKVVFTLVGIWDPPTLEIARILNCNGLRFI
jgi:hypothetical protein